MNPTVLIVDDDEFLLSTLCRVMHNEPYRFVTATSASQAIDLMNAEPVDVVISDDQMPNISGIEFFSQLRHLFPGTVRIMLTGELDPSRLLQAINEGNVFRFLVKPCRKESIVEALHHAIGFRQILIQGRDAIRVIRMQAEIIRKFKEERPQDMPSAINHVAAIRIDEKDFDSAQQLAQEISSAIEHFSIQYPALDRKK